MGYFYDYIVPRGPVPTITSIAPNEGSSVGGTPITITGTNFVAGAKVYCNGVLCTSIVVVSGTSITAVTPASATGGPAVFWIVSALGAFSATATFTYSPIVNSVSPATGSFAGGNSVDVNGSGFINGATVTFDGVAATGVTFVSSAKLTCIAPAGALGTADVVVTNPAPDSQTSGTTGNAKYTYTSAFPAPTVTGVTPNTGPAAGGTAITNLSGTGFQNGAAVYFGAAPATSVVWVSATKLQCDTPANAAGAADITVVNPDTQDSGASGDGLFLYVAAPVITGITPNTGSTAGGTAITELAGTGFQLGATVDFDFLPATSVVVVSSTKITCVTPLGSAGPADVKVTNPDAQDSGASGNGIYTYGTPYNFGSLDYTLLIFSEDYAPGGITAFWPGTASLGTSGGETLSVPAGNAPSVGASLNGFPTVEFTGGKFILGSVLSTFVTADAESGWFLIYITSIVAGSNNAVGVNSWMNVQVFGNLSGYWGVALSTTPTVQAWRYPTGTETPIALGQWQYVFWRKTGAGAPLKIGVNAGALASAGSNAIADLTTRFRISGNGLAPNDYTFVGFVAAGGLSKTAFSDANREDIRQGLIAKYGIPLA